MSPKDVVESLTAMVPTRQPFFLWGPPGVGKCLDADAPVLDATTGEYVPIHKFNISHKVLSHVNGEMVAVRPIAKKDQGKQEAFLIKTQTGREIIATAMHPFFALFAGAKAKYTDARWCPLSELVAGESRIAVTSDVPVFGSDQVDDDELKLAAYLIGDGHYKRRPAKVGFTNADPIILEEFRSISSSLGLGISEYPKRGSPAIDIALKNAVFRGSRSGSDAVALLDKVGLKFALAGEKEIPNFVFRLPRNQLALFLNRLFSTDGSVCIHEATHKKTGPMSIARVSYSSKSKKLIHQLQLLLDRFGIIGYIRVKRVDGNLYYELQIMNSQSILRFEEIGFYGARQKRFERALEIAQRNAKIGHRLGNGVVRFGLLFDRILSVEPVGLRSTWDLDVPVARNFSAAGFVVHNSSIVHQVAKTLDRDVIDLRAVLLDPIDLRGLPHVNGDKRAVWCPPAFMPLKGSMNGRKGIIFADELPQAPPLVQAAFLQGILDHRIGEIELDPEWIWVAAGNRAEDRAGAHRMITPLLNRFGHIDLDVHHEQWNEWAVTNSIAPEVRMFIAFRPGLLHKFDPASHDRAFPTPRSWHFVSNVLAKCPEHLITQIVSGLVGQGPATEFTAFHRTYHDLPDVDELLKDPTNFKPPTDPAILFALSGALAERARGGNHKILGNIFAVCNRLPGEYSVLTIRDSAAVNRQILNGEKVPGASEWMKKHRKVLLDV